MTPDPRDTDGRRFPVHRYDGRGFELGYVHEGRESAGRRLPLVLLHGWPETKRIWWRVIQPLVDRGFEVVVPDLRGFGDSEVGPDGYHDVPSFSRDVHALVHDHLGHATAVVVGGDLGGWVAQDLALRFPGFVDRMVLFNCGVPKDRERMAGLRTESSPEALDYFHWHADDADAVAEDLPTERARRRYVSTFYGSRFWAHPGTFDPAAVAFHSEPFGDAARFRATLSSYESYRHESARSEPSVIAPNEVTRTLILFGTSDSVLYPDFDRMAAIAFPHHVGPYLVRDCGHFVPWEAPDVLVSGIDSFCTSDP
jgi:pimeloyl-ACP methyl ester carboxylesterase